ncbi:Ppx/GppA phosphatase family protein [Ignavibacteria bacterium]
MRVAAIDIGTNTLLMTIGERTHGGTLRVLRDEHSIARLGAGVDAAGNIGSEAIERAANILRHYRTICDELNVQTVVAVGTSALRDAANRDKVCAALGNIIGAEIRVIDGATEAALSFRGTTESNAPAVVIDIGGGSTEIIAGRNCLIEYRESVNIGAVRLTERFFDTLPPKKETVYAVTEFIFRQLPDTLPTYHPIAVAGTATTLAAIACGGFFPERIYGYKLSLDEATAITERLLRLSPPEIIAIPGVHSQRADILPAGAVILISIMKKFNLNACTISTRGLRFGVLLEII